jgi:hypothetical protein
MDDADDPLRQPRQRPRLGWERETSNLTVALAAGTYAGSRLLRLACQHAAT